MNIPPELERKIIAMPGVVVRYAQQPKAEPEDKPEPKEPVLVEPSVVMLSALTVTIPVVTRSEINLKDWKARNRRNSEAWKAVSRTLGPHLKDLAPYAEAYAADRALRVTFTRLGGRRMDQSNLPTATKATEDAVAFMLGADDGDPRWHPSWKQEPGGPHGVRVEIEIWETS
jgi:hypothetical protein